MKTYRFRIKRKNTTALDKMARSVNFVWNYCNDTAIQYLDKRNKWLSGFDLDKLTAGCADDLSLNSQTIQRVCHEYVAKRKQTKRRKLAWRSAKRSLGWIPFKSVSVQIDGDTITHRKTIFRLWKSREIEGKVKQGCFSQDTKGNWYVNLTCDAPTQQAIVGVSVGVDLGLKTIATLSDGSTVTRENLTAKYERCLAASQRARKKRQVTNIYAKIKNVRRDFNHKATTEIVKRYGQIFVGDVSPSKLTRTRFAKSISDVNWAEFKSMLAYKAISLGVGYKEVNEKFSTVTCSVCLQRTGPSGLSALGVREWKCSCGAVHDRDVNAAQNILRFGRESLIKGAACAEASKQKENVFEDEAPTSLNNHRAMNNGEQPAFEGLKLYPWNHDGGKLYYTSPEGMEWWIDPDITRYARGKEVKNIACFILRDKEKKPFERVIMDVTSNKVIWSGGSLEGAGCFIDILKFSDASAELSKSNPPGE